MHIIILVLACFLFGAAPANADMPDSVVNAGALAKLCTSAYDTDAGYCVGYVTAVANRMAMSAVDGYGPCNFATARSQQFADLFIAYAQSYPDSLHAPAESIIAVSLVRAFPCQKH